MTDKENHFVDKLEAILEQHYSDAEFSVTKMASELAMSDRQLQRKLKTLIDYNPADYLRTNRLMKAVALLKSGMRIGIVSEAVGFSSQAYFSSCFKVQFGATPKQIQQILV